MLALLAPTAVSQWRWQNPLPQGNDIHSIFVVDDTVTWAACSGGVMLKTTNGGNTWESRALPERVYSETVFFHDNERGWVGGALGDASGLLFRTTDGGITWEESLADLQDFRTIAFANDRQGWVSGQGARVWHTTDGGASWQLQVDFPFQFINALCFVDSLNGWGAGRVNRRIHTTNGGSTWSIDTLEYSLYDIQFVDSLMGWQCGESRIEATTDGGETWQVQFDAGPIWESIFMLDNRNGWAVSVTDTFGNPIGLVAKTTNGGLNWTFQTTPSLYSLEDIYFSDSLHGMVVGDIGTILKTTNSGEVWAPITDTVTAQSLSGIHIVDPARVWIVGRGGTILRTSNGGNEWSMLPSGITTALNDIYFVNVQSGWTVGEASTILRSTNGGDSWITQSSPTAAGWRDIEFSQYPTGWIVGGGRLIKSTNGGDSWVDATTTTFASGTSKVQFTGPNTGWIMAGDVAFGGEQVVYRTTDGGSTWAPVVSNNSDSAYLSMSFLTDSIGWVASLRGGLLLTEDGGSTWERVVTPAPLGAIHFADLQRGWGATGGTGDIYGTTNGGQSWVSQHSPSSWIIREVKVNETGIGWAVGTFGTILHTTNGGSTFVEEGPSPPFHPTSPSLSQNYPNPFNPVTTIVYQIVKRDHVLLKVYNLLGEEVLDLVDGIVEPGTHTVQVHAGDLASGMYFYRLATSSGATTRKMVLIR